MTEEAASFSDIPENSPGPWFLFTEVERHTIVRALDRFIANEPFTAFEEAAARSVMNRLDLR